MNLLNPGVQYVIITDPENEESVTISGHDISPSSTLEKEVLTRGVSSAGSVTQINTRWELDLQFADASAFSSLLSLPKQSTYQFTIVKFNGFVFWRENREFLIDEAFINDPESEDYPYTLRMNGVFNDPDIIESLNAVAPIADNDGDDLIDGFILDGTNTGEDFTGGVQEITTTDVIQLYRRLILPFPGMDLEYSVEVEDAPASRYIRYADITDTELSKEVGTYTTAGVKTSSITLPDNVFYVDVGVQFGNNSASSTGAFSNLSLQLRST